MNSPVSDHLNSYYDENASAYAERTLQAPAPPLFDRFLASLPATSDVLDLGCGAGRELRKLVDAGHNCVGVDMSRQLAKIAEAYSGIPVKAGDMRAMEFEPEQFDGILAIASILHLDRRDRFRMLASIATWLPVGGLFLSTMKIGERRDRAVDGRVYTLIEPDNWISDLREHGLPAIAMQQTLGAGDVSNSVHDWLAVLARKG